MKINTKATNIELTLAISEYLTKKLESIEKIVEDPESAMCQIEVAKTTNHHRTGDVFRAEINLTAGGKNYYVFSEKDNLFAAIDEMKDEVMKEIKSKKERETSLIRRGGKKVKDMLRGLEN
ncbi:ribosome-associated translation inhibitor RaiA [Candidatus Parcubacteria bacterium]|nr:ribosome-associated translation inhibitor RaiA [Candidatus Parcubacteria bacterium]